MIEWRRAMFRSWADPMWGRIASAELGERLVDRCRGEKGVLLTLTYAAREWSSARECWHAQREGQHLPLFMRRLGRALGEDLAGRWFAKVEFQESGFVHFHVVLLGRSFVAHDLLEACWGHGFVWVNRLTAGRIRYACKYVSKGGAVPAFILAERGLRLTRSSRGFWAKEKRGVNDGADGVDCDSGRGGESGPGGGVAGVSPARSCERVRWPFYVSVGERMRRQHERTEVLEVESGRRRVFDVPLHEFTSHLRWLSDKLGGFVAGRPGWLRVEDDPFAVDGGHDWWGEAAWFADQVGQSSVGGGWMGRGPAKPAAAFHSTDVQKDDVFPDRWDSSPGWTWADEVILAALLEPEQSAALQLEGCR